MAMTPPTVYRYDPFELRHGSNVRWHSYVQEVVAYGESRLQRALIEMMKHNREKHKWMQDFLRSELYLFMSYVGISTSIGIQLEIPIVLRSLGEYFANLGPEDLPAQFDLDFIQILGLDREPTNPHSIVQTYFKPWWSGGSAARHVGPLTETDLAQAIDQHRTAPRMIVDDSPLTSPTTPAPPALYLEPEIESKAAAISLLHALQRASITMNALATSAETDRLMLARRACSFLMLHEAAIIQDETDDRGLNPDGIPLYSTPNEKSQWIFGNPLTEKQVLEILPSVKRRERDGYLHELRTGKLTKEWSTGDTIHDDSSIFAYSAVIQDEVPEASNTLPTFFNHADFENLKREGQNIQQGAGISKAEISLTAEHRDGDISRPGQSKFHVTSLVGSSSADPNTSRVSKSAVPRTSISTPADVAQRLTSREPKPKRSLPHRSPDDFVELLARMPVEMPKLQLDAETPGDHILPPHSQIPTPAEVAQRFGSTRLNHKQALPNHSPANLLVSEPHQASTLPHIRSPAEFTERLSSSHVKLSPAFRLRSPADFLGHFQTNVVPSSTENDDTYTNDGEQSASDRE